MVQHNNLVTVTMSLQKHRKTLSNVLNNNNPRVSNDLEAKVLGIGTVLYEVLETMDQITEAYVRKIEAERDEAVEHAAEADLDKQELQDHLNIALAMIRELQKQHDYPVAIPN